MQLEGSFIIDCRMIKFPRLQPVDQPLLFILFASYPMNRLGRIVFLWIVVVSGLAQAQQYNFMKMIPSAKDARVKNAVAVAISPERIYYVLDHDAAAIYGYDSTGAQTATITNVVVDKNPVTFKQPVDLYIDQRGIMYIVDEGLNKILVRRPDGTGMALGTNGSDLGQISEVKSIVANFNGYIFVLSGATKRVDVFTPSGQYRTWIAGASENFKKPIALGVNGANELYVLDKDGPVVYIFDNTGNFVGVNQHRESVAGVTIGDATDIAVLKNGDYFIVDGEASKVTHFRRGGTSVGTMGSKGGSSKGVFEKAERLATSATQSNILLILDRANGAIQQFQIPGKNADLVTPPAPPEMKAMQTSIKPFLDLAYAPNDIHYIIPESDPSSVEGYNDSSDAPVVTFKVKKAVALGVDDSSNLFVLDNDAREVITYDKQGVLVRRFGQEINDKLKDPTGMAILSDGSVIIADHGSESLKRWTNAGVYDRVLITSLPNVMEAPYKVKVDGKDLIYVWDDNLNVVSRFARDGLQKGSRLLKLRSKDAGEDKGKIAGFEIDAYDQVHLFNATTDQYEVFKWDDNGVPVNLFRYGRPSDDGCEGCFGKVSRIGLDQRSFIAFAINSKANKVTAFKLPFVDYFGDANRLFDSQRYDEAMAAYTLGLKRVGNKPYMRVKIAKRFAFVGAKLSSELDQEHGLAYLKYAATLQTADEKIRAALGAAYVAMFQKLASGENYKDIIPLAGKLAAENERLKPYVLPPVDSIGQTMLDMQNEAPLRAAVGLYQKLGDWDSSADMFFSLARATKKYYDYKKLNGASQLDLTVQLSQSETYAKIANHMISPGDAKYLAARGIYSEILIENRNYDQAVQLLVPELQKEGLAPAVVAQFRQLLVLAYTGQGKPDLAEAEAKRVLVIDPANKEYKKLLAKAYIANKHYDEALAVYQELLADDRKNAAMIGEIGKVHLLRKNFAEASFQLESAVKMDPTLRDLYEPLAEAFDGDGKTQKAVENYHLAIDYMKSKLNYARAHGAGPDEIKAVTLDVARGLTNVGNIQSQLGDAPGAMKSFKEVLGYTQSDGKVYLGLGKAYIAGGLVYDAIEALRTAQKLEPGSVEIGAALTSAMALRDQLQKNAAPVEISRFQVDDLFPSLYRNYADVTMLPIGELTLTNNTAVPISGATVTLFVDNVMSAPTSQLVPMIVGLSNATIRLAAVFKESVLLNGEDKKMQAIVSLKYMYDGKEHEMKKNVTFVMHGRNAISWKDKRRMAAFISTSNELVDYIKSIEVTFRDATKYGTYKSIQKAAQVYNVLNKLQFTYSPDPNVNYAKAAETSDMLDYVQYPAETIMRRSGDCDDLVACYSGLLECDGLATAYIDVPGHVYMAFDTEIDTNNIENAGLSRRDVIVAYGKVWLPIETTMLGKQGFITAWKYGAERWYKEMSDQHFPEIITFADAHKVYTPSTYIPKDFKPVLPANDVLQQAYKETIYGLLEKTMASMKVELEARRQAEPQNAYVRSKLGIMYTRTGQYEKAEALLKEAIAISPESGTFHNNLGNVYFNIGKFDKAAQEYTSALEFEKNDADIFVNLCKTQLALNDKLSARRTWESAIKLRSDVEETYSYMKEDLAR